MCLGRGLAEVELAVVTATILGRRDLELKQDKVDRQRAGVFFAPSQGLLLETKKRPACSPSRRPRPKGRRPAPEAVNWAHEGTRPRIRHRQRPSGPRPAPGRAARGVQAFRPAAPARAAEAPGIAALWPRLAVAVGGKLAPGDPLLTEGWRSPSCRRSPAARRGPALCHGPLDVAEVSAEVARAGARRALLLFLGTVRNHHQGRAVAALDYSSYESMAAERLETICRELESRGPGAQSGDPAPASARCRRARPASSSRSPRRTARQRLTRPAAWRSKGVKCRSGSASATPTAPRPGANKEASRTGC